MSIIFPIIDDYFVDHISVYVYTNRYYWAFNLIMDVNRDLQSNNCCKNKKRDKF